MWIKMKASVVNEDKGYLEINKSYNVPEDLAKEFIKNNIAKKKSE